MLSMLYSLRIFALFSHFIMTTFLVWVKFDSIQVMSESNHQYATNEWQYELVVVLGLIILIFKFFFLGFVDKQVSFSSCINLALDCFGTVFITWMLIDGWDWRSYVVIFTIAS